MTLFHQHGNSLVRPVSGLATSHWPNSRSSLCTFRYLHEQIDHMAVLSDVFASDEVCIQSSKTCIGGSNQGCDSVPVRASKDLVDFRSNHLWPLAVEADTVRDLHFGMILPKLRALLTTAGYQQETYLPGLSTDELPYSRSYLRLLVISLTNGFAGIQDFPAASALRYLQLRFSGSRLLNFVTSMEKHACASFAESLLQCAVRARQPEVVDFILSRKQFMVEVDREMTFVEYGLTETTPMLIYAIRNRDAATTKILISHGANVSSLQFAVLEPFRTLDTGNNEESVEMVKILFYANLGPDELFSIISCTKMTEDLARICERALDKYAEVYWQEFLRSGQMRDLVLRLAPDVFTRIVQRLIEAGAIFSDRIALPYDTPKSTIDAAAKIGNLMLVRLLQTHGAKCTSTTFAFAIESGNCELVRALCKETLPPVRAQFEEYVHLSQKVIAEDPYGIGPDMISLLEEYNLIAPDYHGQVLSFLTGARIGDMKVVKSLLHSPNSARAGASALSPKEYSTQAVFQSALSLAISGEHEEVALTLLDAGVSVVAFDYAAIHQALKMRSRRILEFFLRYIGQSTVRMDSPIFAAAMDWGERDIIIGLLEAEILLAQRDKFMGGSDVQRLQDVIVTGTVRAVTAGDKGMVLILSDALTSLPIHRPFQSEPLLAALQYGDRSMFQLLLSLGFGLEFTAPILAACDHDIVRLFELCQGWDQRHVSGGKSLRDIALKHLIWRGKTTELTQFLELSSCRSDVRSSDADGIEYLPFCLDFCAPLAVAVNADHTKRLAVTKTMLEYGADPNGIILSQTLSNVRPQHFRIMASHEHITPLLQAIRNNDLEIAMLLIQFGANVNQAAKRMIQYTPLQQAAIQGSYEMTRLLLENGAEVDTGSSWTSARVLPFGAMGGYSGIVELLIEYGADVNAYEPSRDDQTALRAAVKHGRLDVVRLLLDHGAALHYANYREKPKLQMNKVESDEVQLAKHHGHSALAKLLRAHDRRSAIPKVKDVLGVTPYLPEAFLELNTHPTNDSQVRRAVDVTMTASEEDHVELHTTKLSCSECGKVLSNASSLKRHIRSKHLDLSAYTCSTCSRMFKRRDLLQRHIMTTHANVGKVPCATCGNFFRRDYYHSTHLTADGRCRNRRTNRARKTLS